MSTAFNLSLVFEEDQTYFGEVSDILQGAGTTVVFDCETTGLRWWSDQLLGVGFYLPKVDGGKRFFVRTLEPGSVEALRKAMYEIARDPKTVLIAHNIKFDCHFIGLHLPDIECAIVDTAVMAHLWDSRTRKSLGELEALYLGTVSKKDYVSKRNNSGPKEIYRLPLGAIAEYCLNDCEVTYRVARTLMPKLQSMQLVELLWRQMRFTRLLYKVERRGIRLDLDFLAQAENTFYHNLLKMEAELYGKAKRIFDWRSPHRLGHALYEGMGHPRPVNPFADADGVDRSKFAMRGKYNKTSTSSFLLNEKAGHPLGLLVMDLRESDKLLGDVRNWKDRKTLHRDSETFRIHTSFNQTGTRTGRLSSSQPNLQNIASDVRVRETQSVYSGGSIRSGEYNLRQGFVADKGMVMVSIDYKQQEMRMFAVMAKEEAMLEACRQRLDIHAEIAKAVWAEEIARDPSILKVRREWSKTIGFGLIYGMTTGSLQHRLNKTHEEAEQITHQYWERFPRVMPFLHEVVATVKKNGWLRYWSGRIWREDDPDKMYKGANAMVQGGSADMLAEAAMRCDEYLTSTGRGWVSSFIHDELLFSVRAEDWEETARELRRIMEVEDLLGIPFTTDVKVGPSYGSMKEVDL